MFTLVEAALKSKDEFLKGFIETIITEEDLMSRVTFQEIEGNSLKFNLEKTLPTVQFYSVGDTWQESTGTTEQKSVALTILGGDADTDKFVNQTMSNLNKQEAISVEMKAKAVARTFAHEFIYGDPAGVGDVKGFNGLHKLIDPSMQLHQGAAAIGAALNIKNVDALLDKLPGHNAQFLVMNKATRRNLNHYYRSKGGHFHIERGDDGKLITLFGDAPIIIDDWLTFTETISGGAFSAETGGATTSIFAVRFGDRELSGLQNGGIDKTYFDKLETKDATRWRFKWYVGTGLFNKFALARLDGITDTAVVDS